MEAPRAGLHDGGVQGAAANGRAGVKLSTEGCRGCKEQEQEQSTHGIGVVESQITREQRRAEEMAAQQHQHGQATILRALLGLMLQCASSMPWHPTASRAQETPFHATAPLISTKPRPSTSSARPSHCQQSQRRRNAHSPLRATLTAARHRRKNGHFNVLADETRHANTHYSRTHLTVARLPHPKVPAPPTRDSTSPASASRLRGHQVRTHVRRCRTQHRPNNFDCSLVHRVAPTTHLCHSWACDS